MITLEEAKKTLGDTAKDMSDEEIIKVVESLTKFANILIDMFLDMTPEERKKFSKKTVKSKQQSKQKP